MLPFRSKSRYPSPCACCSLAINRQVASNRNVARVACFMSSGGVCPELESLPPARPPCILFPQFPSQRHHKPPTMPVTKATGRCRGRGAKGGKPTVTTRGRVGSARSTTPASARKCGQMPRSDVTVARDKSRGRRKSKRPRSASGSQDSDAPVASEVQRLLAKEPRRQRTDPTGQGGECSGKSPSRSSAESSGGEDSCSETVRSVLSSTYRTVMARLTRTNDE